MKLSKKLIVTSLLFSSVLSSINVGSITTFAAVQVGTADSGETKNLKIKYILNNNILDSKSEKLPDMITVNKSDLIKNNEGTNFKLDEKSAKKIIIPFRYEINSTFKDNYSVYGNIVFVYLNAINPDSSAGHAGLDKKQVKFVFKDGNKVLEQLSKTKSVNIIDSGLGKHVLPIDVPTVDGYKILNEESLNVKEDGNENLVNVQVKKSKNITIKYLVDGKEKSFNDSTKNVEVFDDSQSIDPTDVIIPSGYELLPTQKFLIDEKKNVLEMNLKKTILVQEVRKQEVKLQFIDSKGFSISDSKLPTVIKVNEGLKKLSLKDIKLPAGYAFVNNEDVFIKDGAATVKIKKAPVINLVVLYIDKDTKKPVSKVMLSGKAGMANKLDIPKGYKVVDGSSNVVKFGKDNAVVTVIVEKVTPITDHKSTVATHVGTMVSLYDLKGKMIGNRGLSENSTWASDKTMVLNGSKYYRVATDEWVKANDVYEYVGKKMTITTNNNGKFKALYTAKGKTINNRGLATNSSWQTDRSATINGEKMYRVATNEWVKASDIK